MHGIQKIAYLQTFFQHVFSCLLQYNKSSSEQPLRTKLNNSTPCAFTSSATEQFYYKQEGCICKSTPHNPSGVSIEPYAKRHRLVYKASVQEYKTLTSPPAHTIKSNHVFKQPLIHKDIFEPPLRQSKCTFDVFV